MTLYKIPKSGKHVCQVKVKQPVVYGQFDCWYGSTVPLADTLSLSFDSLCKDSDYQMENQWKRLDGRDIPLVIQRAQEMTELLECIHEHFDNCDTKNSYMKQIASAASMVRDVVSPMDKIYTTISLANKRCKIFSKYQQPSIPIEVDE